MSATAVVGTRPLLAATLKFEGRKFAPWIAIATVLSWSSVIVYPWIFDTAQERAQFAATVGSNPALGLIFGPAFDLATTDGFNAWRSLALGGFITALGMIFVVTRAVREQEDNGQAELLAAGVLGRSSRLLVGLAMGFIGSLLVGLVSGVVTGVSGGGWEDSMLLCLTFTATGWMFTGIAATTSQLGSDSKAANSLAVGTLGVLFILRGFLYSVEAPQWLIWLNPLSWLTETRPASGNHWWPLLLAVGLCFATSVVAFILQNRRDFGQGIVPPRFGAARGKMKTSWDLVLRLNRSYIVIWAIAAAGLGVLFGYFVGSITDLAQANPDLAKIFAAHGGTPSQLIHSFLVTILCLEGIILAIPGVQVLVGLNREENLDRLEPVIVAGGSRIKHMVACVGLGALLTATLMLLAAAVCGAVVVASDLGVGFWDVMRQAVVTIPAMWALVGVATAVVGARPKVAVAAWAGVIASFALTLLGPTFNLWDWVLAISPFWHVPNMGADSQSWTGIVVVTLISVALAGIGTIGFRNRDLAR